MVKKYQKKAMALSGGGAHTISYVGVWKYIHDEMGYTPDLISGTSGGALFGCFMAAGLDATKIRDVLIELKPWQYFPLRPMKWISHLFSEWGALDIQQVRTCLQENLNKFDIDWNSFKNTEFRCVVADISDGTYRYIPNQMHMPLDIAVSASVAIPFVFEPIWYPENETNKHCYVDGGLCEGFPIRCALENNENTKILAMSPFDPKKIRKNTIQLGIQYPKAMYKTLLNCQKEMTLQFLDKERGDIEFYCGSIAKNGLDFNKRTIEKNFKLGYNAAVKNRKQIDAFFND